ncbi:MAG: sodium:solute symporter family protein [Lewinellaceae bacterium]|nr:sodium:solute symporter family protein [Saprospiraceae bacterium]MCB9336639.1 sodium:solute symporter family protein [Lewinellaceae bacterium]
MDNNQIIIILFGVLYFGFIIYTRRKGDFEEFSVAGRSLGTFLIFATLSASYIGPASTLGLSRDGFNNGLFLCFIAVFSGVAMVLNALFLAPKIREKFTDSCSIGDVMGGPRSHNHKAVRIAVGIVSAWFMAAITIAMSYAGGELVNNVFGFPKMASIAVITVIVIVYSSFGGIRATIQTDAFQFICFAVIIPLLALSIISSDGFSWQAYTAHATANASLAFDANTAAAILGMYLYWIISGAGFDAAFINRFLASKDMRVTKQATAFAGVFYSAWVILMVFIGSAGAFLQPELANSDQVWLQIAASQFHGILYGIFIIAMIGVVMSTQDTTLNISSINFSEDIIAGFRPGISDERKLFYAKLFTVIVGAAAILIAGFLDSILNAIIVIFSFYIPVMIPVTFFSVLKKKHHWQSAIASMVVGFLSNLIWELVGSEALPTLLVGLVFSTMAYWLTDLFMEKRKGQTALALEGIPGQPT